MSVFIIRNATLLSDGTGRQADMLVRKGFTVRIALEGIGNATDTKERNAIGLPLLPGANDDQGHFREPGPTHKVDIAGATAAAALDRFNSYMAMPNTVPNALTQELLADAMHKEDKVDPSVWVGRQLFEQ